MSSYGSREQALQDGRRDNPCYSGRGKKDKGSFMAQPSGAAAKIDALKWRCIGPPRGGRVVAVAGDPKDHGVFYFGACAGGVWKTIDGGIYWRCVSDGFFGSAAIGALAVAL